MNTNNKYLPDSCNVAIDKDVFYKVPERLGIGIKGILLETGELLEYADQTDHNIARINQTPIRANQLVKSSSYTDDNCITELLYKEKNEQVVNKVNSKFNGITAPVITIELTSKHFKEKYFNGINNIQSLHNLLEKANLLIDIDVLVNNARARDVDFKNDIKCNDDDFDMFTEMLALKTKLTTNKNIGFNRFGFDKYGKKNKDYEKNVGIEFGKRDQTYNEFLKAYDKDKEMKYKSKEFKEHYLPDIDLTGIKRIEFNTPSKFLQSYGIGNKFIDVLNVVNRDQTKLKNIVGGIISKNIEIDRSLIAPQPKMMFNKNISIDLYNSVVLCRKLKMTEKQTIEFIINNHRLFGTHRNTIGTKAKDIKYIYSTLKNEIEFNKYLKTTEKHQRQSINFDIVNNIFNDFGINLNVVN